MKKEKEFGKKITIDDLALVMGRSFGHLEKNLNGRIDGLEKKIDGVDRKIDSVRDELKGEIGEVRDELLEKMATKAELHVVKEIVVDIDDRLSVLERKWPTSHENRISRLEDDVRVLKTTKG